MLAKTKTIKMLLYDGSLNGVTNISDSAWESGKMYSAPRESISSLVSRADCKKYGVYLLLSTNQVYIGQAIDLERRTKQHLADKDWWTQVVLMTTKDDSFTASDIDYLEAWLIDLAIQAGTSDSDNKKMGNRQKVDEFRQAELEQYLDEALFLLELIGIHVFKKESRKSSKSAGPSINLQRSTFSDADADSQMQDDLHPFENSDKTPPLPDDGLPIGAYVKKAMSALSDSGYIFSTSAISEMCSSEWSQAHFGTKHPFMRIYIENKTDNRDSNNYVRFWSSPFSFGDIHVLISKEWYERQRDKFKTWYMSL